MHQGSSCNLHPTFLVVEGMPSAGWLAAVIMSTLVKSSVAFRISPKIGREIRVTQLHSFRCCNYTTSRGRPSMLLGGEAGIGIVGISAVGAIRLLTANLVRKRVRVVTDIDDTVKSSGNKRLLGVPLGGIDAQCETLLHVRHLLSCITIVSLSPMASSPPSSLQS